MTLSSAVSTLSNLSSKSGVWSLRRLRNTVAVAGLMILVPGAAHARPPFGHGGPERREEKAEHRDERHEQHERREDERHERRDERRDDRHERHDERREARDGRPAVGPSAPMPAMGAAPAQTPVRGAPPPGMVGAPAVRGAAPPAPLQPGMGPRFAPPPPRPERPAVRPGQVWAPGYHEWRGDRYVWVDGHYEADRPGYFPVAPRWEFQGGLYVSVPGAWLSVESQPSVPPPPPVAETVVVRPGFVWIPGYQDWNGSAYVWAPGRWEQERPRERWHPGQWEQHGNHWRWHRGGWHRH